MSRYEFEDKNCVVYADERFGEIRTVRDENGERRYVGIDIADCMGFEAPNKAVTRSKIPGKMIKVPGIRKPAWRDERKMLQQKRG